MKETARRGAGGPPPRVPGRRRPPAAASRRTRRWGQNFLVNRGAVATILAEFAPAAGDTVLEIGPGRGALTGPLLERAGKVAAVEIDPALASSLARDQAAAVASGRLEVIAADVLDLDLGRFLAGLGASAERPARVLANLPYSVATEVVVRLLRERGLLADIVVMVQREVAARILARPGTKEYGGLTVLCQAAARVESVLRLKPGSFRPIPKVDSEVVRLTPSRQTSFDLDALSALLRAAFGQRRKTLQNNLANLPAGEVGPGAAGGVRSGAAGGRLGPAGAAALARAAGLEPGLRPEDVPVDGYLQLLRHAPRPASIIRT